MECKGFEGEAAEGGLWCYDHAIVHIAKEDVRSCCWNACCQLTSCSVIGMLARIGEIWFPMPVP